jgi:hypothetical protein
MLRRLHLPARLRPQRGTRPRRSLATAAFFRVPAAFHREFKLYAVQNGLTMVDLLQESFRAFQQKRS